MQDLEDMLGFRPHAFYFYMWKYVSPCCLIVLITATVIEMAISPPGYSAWVEELVSQPVGKQCKVSYRHFVLTLIDILCISLVTEFAVSTRSIYFSLYFPS